MVVVGCKGVKRGQEFALTCPTIHCTDLLCYGKYNMGKKGIEWFKSAHVCNDICTEMGLAKLREMRGGDKIKMETEQMDLV
jgi:hypothetical protein